MKTTRRSVLKSGVAGLVAAGTGAPSVAQETPVKPKAVICNGAAIRDSPEGYSITTFIGVNADGIELSGFPGTFTISSFNFSENMAKNIPQTIETIQINTGLVLKPEDLLFVGFDFFNG